MTKFCSWESWNNQK